MVVINTDQVLMAFLESDLTHWINEPASPPIERDAMYRCRLLINGVQVSYEVLVYRDLFKKDDTARRITLSYALMEKQWFGDQLLERSIELSGAGSNVASLTWPETDDEVINKVAAIAKVAPMIPLAPQSIN